MAGNDEIKPRIMTSASGRERFSCARVSSIENSRSGIYEIVISGDFWSRAEPLETASLSLDFQVRLPQVLLSEDGMETLRDHLVTWLDDQLSFECMISPELNFDQILPWHWDLTLGLFLLGRGPYSLLVILAAPRWSVDGHL